MKNFKENDITVFKDKDFSVVLTEPETIQIKNKEIVVSIRDFRKKKAFNGMMYLIGALNGALLLAALLSLIGA